ncbi:hypothetical protein NPIL_306661 [Nephila pilipes]|uniref:Uncharacterized protein n=1 Tax=Nephila pilipes TaxID=299642 RepID=A0A8X6Q6M4_NEPPI|nr:hypothetical protein NPIL_306661 [Nephila pilipes]
MGFSAYYPRQRLTDRNRTRTQDRHLSIAALRPVLSLDQNVNQYKDPALQMKRNSDQMLLGAKFVVNATSPSIFLNIKNGLSSNVL